MFVKIVEQLAFLPRYMLFSVYFRIYGSNQCWDRFVILKLNCLGFANGAKKIFDIYIQTLEATLESFPQCVIQLYYLIRVGFGDENQTIVILSSILSIWNIVAKMVSADKSYVKPQYQSLELKWESCSLNWLYICRVMARLIDFIHRLFIILVTWLGVGGLPLCVYLGFELVVLFFIAVKTKQLSYFFHARITYISKFLLVCVVFVSDKKQQPDCHVLCGLLKHQSKFLIFAVLRLMIGITIFGKQ